MQVYLQISPRARGEKRWVGGAFRKEPAEQRYQIRLQRLALVAREGQGVRAPFDYPLQAHIIVQKEEDPASDRFGDIDNLQKSVLDAMKGVLFTDDRLIVKITAEKRRGPGGITIRLDPL